MSGYFEMRRKYFKTSLFPPWLATDTSLWLKADNPLNTNVRWHDASPNNHVLNGTATLTDNVLNGQKGYVFNGSSNYFNGGDILDRLSNDRTIIWISKDGVNGAIYSKSLGSNRDATYKANGNRYVDFTGYGGYTTWVDNAFSFKKFMTTLNMASGIVKAYQNGVEKGSLTINTVNRDVNYDFLIGAYTTSSLLQTGTICEIIFLDRLLTTAENTELNAYLLTKYGL